MAVQTKGTQLYMIAPTIDDPVVNEVIYISCITSVDPGADGFESIKSDYLDCETEQHKGNRTESTATFGINPDPRNASHVRIYSIYKDDEFKSGTRYKFVIGWADGTGIAPTLNSAGDDFDLPETRTWTTFDGFVSSFPMNFNLNAVVESSIEISRYGGVNWHPKTADAAKPTAISLSSSTLAMQTGDIETLSASVTPAEAAQGGYFSSSNESVATVTAAGIVTAKSAGTATITVRAYGDTSLMATCNITVTEA